MMRKILFATIFFFTIGLLFAQKKPDIPEDILTAIDTNATNFLDQVVITGTRTRKTLKNTPVLTKVVPASELKETGALTVLDALENMMPGVHFDPNPMGDNIQIQGLGNKYILVLVNGERLVNERTENVNFARLNIADIEQIEIINGASSVLYGSNAIGAVINIITKNVKKKVEAYTQGRYGNFNTLTLDAGLGLKFGGFTSKTTFNRKTTDGYQFVLQPDNSYKLYAATEDYSASKRMIGVYPNTDYSVTQDFKYKINDQWKAEVNGSYYSHEVLNAAGVAKLTHRLDHNYTLGGKITYQPGLKNHLVLSGNTDIYINYTVTESKMDSVLMNDGTYYYFTTKSNDKKLSNDSYYTSARLIDTWTPSDKLQIVGGGEYNWESTYSLEQFGAQPEDKFASNWNLFAQGELKYIRNLDIMLGGRFTDHSQFGAHFSPKISLMYSLADFRFRGTVSNGFKAPTLKELYMNFDHQGMFDVIGNPDLVPETSWYESLSVEYITGNINASVTGYNNNISNKINTVQYNVIRPGGVEKAEMRYENVEDAQVYGVDVFLQWNLWKRLYLKGAYAFADAIDKADNTQLPGNSKHNATLSLTFKHAICNNAAVSYPFSLLLSGRYSSSRIYATEDETTGVVTERYTGSFNTWRFVYSQTIPIYKSFTGELLLGVDNIFNHIDTEVNINPGRTFFVAFRLNI